MSFPHQAVGLETGMSFQQVQKKATLKIITQKLNFLHRLASKFQGMTPNHG